MCTITPITRQSQTVTARADHLSSRSDSINQTDASELMLQNLLDAVAVE